MIRHLSTSLRWCMRRYRMRIRRHLSDRHEKRAKLIDSRLKRQTRIPPQRPDYFAIGRRQRY